MEIHRLAAITCLTYLAFSNSAFAGSKLVQCAGELANHLNPELDGHAVIRLEAKGQTLVGTTWVHKSGKQRPLDVKMTGYIHNSKNSVIAYGSLPSGSLQLTVDLESNSAVMFYRGSTDSAFLISETLECQSK